MKQLVSMLFIGSLFLSCATNRIVNKQRVGVWVEKDTVNQVPYRSRGRYKKGMEVGRWRFYTNNILSKVEKYRDSICHTTFYYANGNKQLEGYTKLEITSGYLHWYYMGQWEEYDLNGKITKVRFYNNGQLTTTEKR